LKYIGTATVSPERPAATFATRFDPSKNNFDLLRIGFAILVIFCHCFSLKRSDWEPVNAYLHYGYGGLLAVDAFLVISGFLVTRSLCERSLDDYVFARIARVVPGLALVTLVEVFVIGAAFTKERLWVFLSYVGFRHLGNVTVFGLDSQLYSVFPDTNPPWMMNGSLWTIPIECSFYIVLPVVMLLFGLRRSVVPLFFLSLAAYPVARYFGLSQQAPGTALFASVHAFPFIDLASYFLAGAAAWIARDRVPFNLGLLAISLVGLYAAAEAALSDLALKLFLPYLVLYAAMAGGLGSRLKRAVGDLSYGTYLFGFPVTLSVIAAGGGLSVHQTFFVAIAITLACAWLSWRYVEQPCLRLKARVQMRRR
jgi:peptidoglycan/LPS O-acetylase OafA/YrhL